MPEAGLPPRLAPVCHRGEDPPKARCVGEVGWSRPAVLMPKRITPSPSTSKPAFRGARARASLAPLHECGTQRRLLHQPADVPGTQGRGSGPCRAKVPGVGQEITKQKSRGVNPRLRQEKPSITKPYSVLDRRHGQAWTCITPRPFNANPRFRVIALCDIDTETPRIPLPPSSAAVSRPATDAAALAQQVKPDVFCFCTLPNLRTPMIQAGAQRRRQIDRL
jgi:hypothetical protein